MKKGVLFLVCAMILTMLAPAQAAQLPKNQEPEMPVSANINGKYLVSVKCGDDWSEVGSLNFSKYQSAETINLGSLTGENIAIKLSQNGGGSAYLDAVLLDGQPAVKTDDNDEKVLKKLSKEDFDITPVGEKGVILEFNTGESNVLTVVGRIENTVISKEPLQFPAENNYKFKDDVENFYSYTLGSNAGALKIDGILDEVSDMDPFVKEYRVPESGHPAGDIYFWVMNDDNYLYVVMDTTPDNTFDGDKDYAKVYVNTDRGIKEFKVSVPEATWGITEFTYTDKVEYEHKVYEFAIPLSECDALIGEEISIAFVAYGTMSYNNNCNNPKLAYDSNNGVYLSVFEHHYYNSSIIVGEFVDKYGDTINYRFPIANGEIRDDEDEYIELLDPSVTFNSYTNEFLVTWIEHHSNSYYVCGKLINYNMDSSEPFIVSLDDESYHRIESASCSYDSDENVFLAVWEEANSTNQYSVFGQFLDENGLKIGDKFNISTTSDEGKRNTSLSYSESQEAFLVAWEDENRIAACGVDLMEDNNHHVSNMIIVAGEGTNEYPDVSYSGSSQRLFVTWENAGILYGQYFDLKNTAGTYYLDPYSVSDKLAISSAHDGYNVAYPSAYYDGSGNMLCVWNIFKPEQESYAELCYVDIYAEMEGSSFYTDEELEYCDIIDTYKMPIAISGDNDSQNIIAYVLEDGNNIGYRIIGEIPSEPMEVAFLKPDIAYDNDNELYLSVFECRMSSLYDEEYIGSQILGEIVDREGNVIFDAFAISSSENNCYDPTVAYDKENNEFMVVWSELIGDFYELMACKVNVDESEEYYDVSSVFSISGNRSVTYNEVYPDLVYGDNGEFLLVWEQDHIDTSDDTEIYGRIIDSSLENNNFPITDDEIYQHYPRVSYNPSDHTYLAAWNYPGEISEAAEAHFIDSTGDLIDNGYYNIGDNFSNFPSVSYNSSNNKFLITWHDYNENSIVLGQYIGLDDEYAIIADDVFQVSPSDIFEAWYPASYDDGNGKMLCVWSSALEETYDCYPRLQYIDDEGNHIYEVFYPDEYDDSYPRDDLSGSTMISISGDNQGCVIIAYETFPPRAYSMNSNHEFVSEIHYLVFGESYTGSKLEFDNAPYNILVGEEIQTVIKLYDEENPTGRIISDDLYYFSLNPDIAAISSLGMLTGKAEGKTSISAIYDPWATVEGDDISFSDGGIIINEPASVNVTEPEDPYLSFVPNEIKKNVGDTFSVKINYFDGLEITEVTDEVVIAIDDPGIATSDSAIKGKFICTAVGETTLRTTYAGITATATLVVREKPSSGSSAPTRTPIGQILVDNKVIKTLYKEDVKTKNNTYIFNADKSGESARLWLDSGFYEALAEDYPDRIIKFNWESGTYTLPLSCDEVLKEIDNSAKKVNILIEKVDDKEIINAAKNSSEGMGAEIISNLIDFSVYIEKSKGNTDIESLDFYAERTIEQLGEINENISTAMKFVENKETLTFAPSVFDDDFATVRYRGNGIFTIVENPQTFIDITNHWAKLNIEKLASRNIAFGKENNNFEPNDFITRAEFAVMITRALGITEEEGANNFTDVSNEWYAEDISTAFSSGLINGRNDGKFYPNEKIQRKDMAVIIQNALNFADMDFDVSNADSVLTMFRDKSIISDYAREAAAMCADAGIIMGRETKNFDPDANATRAEASAIIERMLRYIEFMD